MTAIATWFAKPAVRYGLIAIAVLILIAGTAWTLRNQFSEGKKAGAAAVTTTVQLETIKAQENARREKEQIDEKVRSTPYDDRVDGLR